MRKKTISLLILLMMAFLILTLSGCMKITHKIYESGFFEYVIVGKTGNFPKNKEDQVVAIVRLTELGQEQEIIDIPRMIDGKEVWYIGFRIIRGLMGGNRPYPITSPNLKKMYIHDNIIGIDNEIVPTADEWDIMFCSAVDNSDLGWMNNNLSLEWISDTIRGKVYIYKFWYDKAVEDLQQSGINDSTYGEKILPANVAFLNNYSDEINGGYYRLDNIKSGEKIPQPPSPERECFEFIGWFTDANCTYTWDFNDVKEIENGDEFRLYAGWRLNFY